MFGGQLPQTAPMDPPLIALETFNRYLVLIFPSVFSSKLMTNVHAYEQPGPALAGAGPNARPRRGAPLNRGVMTSSCSVNRARPF